MEAMMLEMTADTLQIPATFSELLDHAGYVEDEMEILLYAAEEGKGEDPRVDYLVKSLQRDLPHSYELQACVEDARRCMRRSCDQEEFDENTKAYDAAKNEMGDWMKMLDSRVEEVMTLLHVIELEDCDKMIAMDSLEDLKNGNGLAL